jgi:hypothetical protein
MAKIISKHTVKTVGECVKALLTFPQDLPIVDEFGDVVHLCMIKPDNDEVFQDPRGEVCINEFDPESDED